MKKERYWICLFILICAVLYSWGLGFPAKEYFDEPLFLNPARMHLHLENYWRAESHPILQKLVLAGTLAILGDTPVVWRLNSLVTGLISIFVLFLIVKKLTRNFRVAALASGLFAVEGIHFVLSRIAMVHAPMLMWTLLSFLAVLSYLNGESGARTRAFCISGICLGIGFAIRWVALGMLAVIGLCLIKKFFLEENKLSFLKDLFIFFVFVPFLIYFSSFLILPLAEGKPWADIWNFQTHLWNFHQGTRAMTTLSSDWWGWPFLVRPVWFFFGRDGRWVNGIFCIGNPAIYWVAPFAMTYTLFKFIQKRAFLYGVILAGFFSQWLPWIGLRHHVKFLYFIEPSMVFGLIAIALLLQRFWQIGKLGKGIVIGYLAVVAVLFIYWYPLYTGLPISEAYLRNHMWFQSWIF